MIIKRIEASESHYVTELFDKYRVFYGKTSDKELARQYTQERLDKNESIIFVAIEIQDEKQISVGFTQLYPLYSSVQAVQNWILNDLYVAEEFRKKGIGEKLVNAALEFAKSKGAKFVQLETATDNTAAQKLYETLGFEKQSPDETFFVYRHEMV